MTKLLIKLFVKNNKEVNNPKVRRSYGTLASIVGIVSNTILCILKLIIGFLSGMISITADALNNLTDASSSIVSLIGFKISGKPADKSHPFGHARMEYITGFMVSIVIAVLGIELIFTSIEKIFSPDPVLKNIFWPIVILVIAVFAKIYQALFNFKVGKIIQSTSLKATAVDSRNDVIATTVVIIGLVISYFTNFNLDGYLGAAVGAFILISGVKLIFETAQPLLGQKPEENVVKSFVELITSFDGILGLHDLQIHSYGPNCIFASCHVEVDAAKDILVSHDLVDNIEKACLEKLKINTVLHMDPVVLNDPLLDKIKTEVKTIIDNYDIKLSMHDFRIVTGPTHTNIVFDIVVPFSKNKSDINIVNEISTLINKLNPSYYAVINVDQEYSDYIKEIKNN